MKIKKTILIITLIASLTMTGCAEDNSSDHQNKTSSSNASQENNTETDDINDEYNDEDQTLPNMTEEITTNVETTESISYEEKRNKDASVIFNAADLAFFDILLNEGNSSLTGTYTIGDTPEVDSLIKDKISSFRESSTYLEYYDPDIINNYEIIEIYLDHTQVVSVGCYDGTGWGGAPVSLTEENQNGFILYNAMRNENKINYANGEAYQLEMSIDSALWDMNESGIAPKDGDYKLHDSEELYENLKSFLDISRFDNYKDVSFRIFTNEFGNKQCAVIISIDGEYFGGAPNGSTIENYSDFSLEDAMIN